MRKVFGMILLLTVLICSNYSIPQALATEGAEVELIIDYIYRHQVTVIIPEGVSPEPLADFLSEITASPLYLEGDWSEGDGTHVWLYSAPQLTPGIGPRKAVLWDTTELADTAARLGLTAGTSLFLVVNQPQGMLSYDVYVNDEGYELFPVAADEHEVWWGFGLQPGGVAPKLSVLIWLKPLLNWLTLSPFWIPLLGASALWMLAPRMCYLRFRRAHLIVSWLVLGVMLLTVNLMQWQAVLSLLLGSPSGFRGQLSFLLVTAISFVWVSFWIRMPMHHRQARQRGQRWTIGRYWQDNWRLLVGFLLLLAATTLWFGLVDLLYRHGLAIALFGGLLALSLMFWLAAEFAPYIRYGRQPWREPQLDGLLGLLSERLQLPSPPLYSVPSSLVWQANAFASGMLFPRVHVTQMLWHTLAPRERQFILAHELAHIRRRDPWRLFALYALPAWLAASGLILLEAVAADWALMVAVVLLLVAALFVLLVALPERRKSELAADSLAVQATGDPAAAASALHRVQRVSQGGLIRRLLRTHPTLETRLEALVSAQLHQEDD